MKLDTLILTQAISAIFSLAMARPIEPRDVGGVLICNGPNSTGYCEHKTYNLDQCYDLATPLYRNASTFAPDDGAFFCYPYAMSCDGICMSPTGCTLGAVGFSYKFKFDLGEIGWDKGISSFACHQSEPAPAQKKR